MALILSPIQFKDSKLLYIAFDDTRQEGSSALCSNEDGPDYGEKHFTLSVDRNLEYSESDGTLSCMGTLRFKMDIRLPGDEDSPIVASVEGAMGAVATCPLGLSDRASTEATLAANTLSYIWAKLRTIVEQLSSQSNIGTLSLPAIDPMQLVGE